ncbi:MAG: hypothetical protein H6767_08740 [Candidatus Peribacteria bacterium]|nr:MAG: hypothetical protein H6767_08740 [Candidatus Peribacteria bacterium]
MENQNLNRVIIGNARTAYFMVFVSWLFLLNKNNPNLNHPFVHAHTKSAMIVHLGFLLTYIICVHYGAGETISILSWQLNYLLASTVFLGLFCSSLYGMYLAGQEKTFHVGELIQVSRDSKILDVHESTSHDEKDMFLIILSYIPFIGYLQYAKYKSSETIQNATKLNLLSTIIIIATYIAGNTNLAIFLLLLYIISVAFISVSLIGSKRLLTLQLRQIPTPGEIPVYLRSFWKYLTQKHETFSEFKNLYKQEQEAEQQEEENWK